jgi:hypothetical protein
VLRLFPRTFKNKDTTWFYSLDEAFIISWRIFETIFVNKFGEDKIPSSLVLYLSRMKMDTNENVKDFNQCFLSLLKKIPWASKPTEYVTNEFYTSTLPMSMAMFV